MSIADPTTPDLPPDMSQVSLARFSTVAYFCLPLITADIFSNTYWGLSSVILSREFGTSTEFLLSPFFHSGVAVALFIVIIGHLLDLARWARRRVAILVSLLVQLAGFSLLTYLDGRMSNGGISDFSTSRMPFLCTAPGCFCSQLSISILQLCGRSFLFENFAPIEQLRAQSWITTFSMVIHFAFKLTFGIVLRSTDVNADINIEKVRIVGFTFEGIALIIGTVAVFLIQEDPPPAWRAPADWTTIGRFDLFPEFLQIAIPLIVGFAPYAELNLMIPLRTAILALDSGSFTFAEGFGYGFVSLACAAVFGIAAAWIPHPRGGLVWSLLMSAIFATFYEYQQSPPSVFVCLAATALAGSGFGALNSAIWTVFGQTVPRTGMNGFIGLLIALTTMFQGMIIQTSFMEGKPRLTVIGLVIAGIAGLRLPDMPMQGDPAYAAINVP